MKRVRLSSIIWGFVLIFILSLTALEFKRADIEIDLEKRAQAALKDNGISWAKFSFTGLNGALHGAENRTQQERQQALTVVRNVYGVLKVRDASKPLKVVTPYTWSASLRNDNLKISMYVPSETDRKAVLGIAQATFPKLTIKDKMKVALGVGDKSIWLGSVSFALKQLRYIKKGHVTLTDNKLKIWGQAKDSDSYINISKKLKESAPKGIKITHCRISPPKVDEYHISIMMEGGRVKLNGYLPDLDMRKNLNLKLSSSMKDAEVVDNLRYASGYPKGWKGMFEAATQQLFKMRNGAMELSDKTIKISGTVDSHQKHATIKKSLTDSMPKGYSLEDHIKVEIRESTSDLESQRQAAYLGNP